MARVIEYTFPATNTQDVCLSQAPVNGGYILNGNLSNTISSEVSFIDKGYSRNISISSVSDVTGVTYTVTGFQNGQKIIENLNGPNNSTVYGNEIYDNIISVTSDDVGNHLVSIGTGSKGFFRIINIDLNNYQVGSSAITLITVTNPAFITTVYGTTMNIVNNGTKYLTLLTTNYFSDIKNSETVDNYFAVIDLPFNSVLIELNGDVTNLNSVTYMNFTQATQFQS